MPAFWHRGASPRDVRSTSPPFYSVSRSSTFPGPVVTGDLFVAPCALPKLRIEKGFGTVQLQVILVLVAMVGAAAVALLCDILRNQYLRQREAKVEAKVRHEELRQPVETPQETQMTTNKVLSEWLIKRAMERAAKKAAAEEPTAVEAPPAAVKTDTYEPVVIDEFLWKSLFQETALSPQPERAVERPVPVAAFPRGFHEAGTLARLNASSEPFSGLVLAIGMSAQNQTAMRAAMLYLQGLLRDNDFGCRASEQEFVLVCPFKTGLEAQRHLTYLTERLWEFQLRSLNEMGIVLSLGSADVQGEKVADALVIARERMTQTRRTRKVVMLPKPMTASHPPPAHL